jgi:hypothetical protein
MVARGKCERSEHAAPGSQIKSARAPEGRQTLWPRFCRPSRPVLLFSNVPGATRFALTPGYHLPRLRRPNDHGPDQDLMLPTMINDVRAGGALWVPKRRRRGRWAGVPKRRRRGRWAGVLSAAGAVDGSQGQVRAQRARCPWITDKKRASPGGATDTLARFCRPSRPVLLFSNVPGATRFALTPGYHLPRLRRSNGHVPDHDPHVPDHDSCSRP